MRRVNSQKLAKQTKSHAAFSNDKQLNNPVNSNEVVTLLYVFREALGLTIGFVNEYLVNRKSKDKILQPKLQFRKYPDKDAFNIDVNVFNSLVIGFPIGYLHKPIPRSLADKILEDIDYHLSQRAIENKHKIIRHISVLYYNEVSEKNKSATT